MRRSLRFTPVLAATVLTAALHALPAKASLAAQLDSGRQEAGALQEQIGRETSTIQGYEGSLSSLRERLAALDGTLAVEQGQLNDVRQQLGGDRLRLSELRADWLRDRRLLAAELVAEYESPPPTVINVIVSARGFEDLLSGLSDLRAVEARNLSAIRMVRVIGRQIGAQSRQLAFEEARRARATAALAGQRDQVAQVKLSIVSRELVVLRARSRTAVRLRALRDRLARDAARLAAQEQAAAAAAAVAGASGGSAPAPSGCINTAFAAHGGAYGFFPAAGTNYGVGEEPVIAARLDALGRYLQIHLIGVSGYRTPQHSVEVGGFADDPHTHGLASDTPGVEGVPEATLERFCLTRPFPGAREADHIQEL